MVLSELLFRRTHHLVHRLETFDDQFVVVRRKVGTLLIVTKDIIMYWLVITITVLHLSE